MSIEDLEEAGMLRPRSEWGKADPHSNVARIPLLLIGVLGLVAAGMIYEGDGGRTTWLGLLLFFAAMALFTWLSLRAIAIRARQWRDAGANKG